MFGHQFYPTPEPLIKRMLKFRPEHEHERLWRMRGPLRILEPSAGSGAILDFIYEHAALGRDTERSVHACEIDPELQAMLQGKGYTVVGNDFLQFRTDHAYDFIIMNPPFDAAAAHIVHAWDMLDGELVALCNAETLNNPRGEHGIRLKQLVDQHGKVEQVGRAFSDALRKTDVEVALIRLERNMNADTPDWWNESNLRMEDIPDVDLGNLHDKGVVRYDELDAVISGYHASRKAFRDYLVARNRLYSAVGPFQAGSHGDPVKEALEHGGRARDSDNWITRTDRHFGSLLQGMAWKSVFDQANFADFATEGVKRNLHNLCKAQQATAFDRPNIEAMLELLFSNRHEILKLAMLETFDELCRFYPGNRSHWEGWKSNEAHMVARKVVLPRCGLSYDRRWGGSFTTYNIVTDDIDRTMAMLDGRKLSDKTRIEHLRWEEQRYGKPKERSLVTIQDAIKYSIAALPKPIEDHKFYDLDNTAESEYFLIRYWKKGTVHLYFKDEQLWSRFNQEAAKGKNWLPFDPEHMPTPKTKPSERQSIKELLQIAEVRAQRKVTAG